ncbi:hypothetical protein Tco_1469245, partial [Tanacetum coccineum]
VARFVDFLAYRNHPAQGVMRNAACKILRLGCMTKKNFIDYGVFVGVLKSAIWRRTWVAGNMMTFVDLEESKSDFEVEAEAYRQLSLEERQRLDEATFETVKIRVTRML